MRYVPFRVIAWMALSSAIQTRQGWTAWAAGASRDIAASGQVETVSTTPPPILRRRVTSVGQLALRAAYCLEQPADEPRVILCSRHGEFSRTLGLIQTVAAGEATSPAEFTLSVHHGLAGLLSIAHRNMAGHTAIAAGPDTFGCGMLEALGCLAA
jgi:Beta-ketoacyl synthase, N-terminal domain